MSESDARCFPSPISHRILPIPSFIRTTSTLTTTTHSHIHSQSSLRSRIRIGLRHFQNSICRFASTNPCR
jgi:hypothetical protein